MAESIQRLETKLHEKRNELNDVGNKLMSAGVGASLAKNPLLGMAAGAFLGREKDKKVQLEREIQEIEGKIKDTQNQISRLEDKKSQLMNDFQNKKVNFEAAMRQERSDLERQKQNEQDPARSHELEVRLSGFQGEINAKERDNEAVYRRELDAVQRQIDQLTF